MTGIFLCNGCSCDERSVEAADGWWWPAAQTPRALEIMRHMPHVLPFEQRVMLFRQWVGTEHARCAGLRTHLTIRRTHVIEDTLNALG